jgi:hypothetical protein
LSLIHHHHHPRPTDLLPIAFHGGGWYHGGNSRETANRTMVLLSVLWCSVVLTPIDQWSIGKLSCWHHPKRHGAEKRQIALRVLFL